MNALDLHVRLDLAPGNLYLVLAPRALGRQLMNTFAARLALAGAIYVLDAGNVFDAYGVARQVRSRSAGMFEALDRLRVARAFTCYQVLALLEQQPARREPTLALDLLATFADESVPLAERERLLAQALEHLRRLSQLAPVAVSASAVAASMDGHSTAGGALGSTADRLRVDYPWRPGEAPPALVTRLEQAADQVLRLMSPQGAVQDRLWEQG